MAALFNTPPRPAMNSDTPINLSVSTAIALLGVVAMVCIAWPQGVRIATRWGELDSRQPQDTKEPA